jgi:hypothetical protein
MCCVSDESEREPDHLFPWQRYCNLVSKTLPVVRELKDNIQTGDFEEANPKVLALLVKMRQANERMKQRS